MFRPGENWVYDIFMTIVRFWWSIFKLVLMVGYALFNRRGSLTADISNHPPRRNSETAPTDKSPLAVFILGAICALPALSLLLNTLAIVAIPGRGPILAYDAVILVTSISFIILGFYLMVRGWTGLSRKTEEVTHEETVMPSIPVYSIQVRKQDDWNSEQALHFIDQLLFSFPYLLFRIHADERAVVWQIVDLVYAVEPSVLEQLIRSSYPRAEISVEELAVEDVKQPFFRYHLHYQQPNMFVAPMLYVTDIKDADPLTALTQAITALQPGERVDFTLTIAGQAVDAYQWGEKLITQSTIHPLMVLSRGGAGVALGRSLSGHDRTQKFVYRDQKVFEDKLREKLYYAYVIIQIDAPTQERVAQIAALVDTQISYFARMPYNALHWVARPLEKHTQRVETVDAAIETSDIMLFDSLIRASPKQRSIVPQLILETRELAAIWHLPHQACTAPRIAWSSGLVDVPETVATLTDGTLLGLGKYQGGHREVRLAEPDRALHLNIIGRTGTGKSTLMHHLIHQDIARGAGVAVLDPHGQLVRDILRTSIPPEREADVVVLDLAAAAYPPPLNPLGGTSSYTGTLRVVGLIERLFAGTEGAARMSTYLRATLLPLQSEPQATMRDVARMFIDEVYRERLLKQVDDPETHDFWDYQFNLSSPALQRQIADPIINRIRPFYANPYLYPVLCHPDSLDFRELISQKKIILISLAMDEEQVPEQERNLVGSLIMSRLQMSGMKRRKADPYYVYVDEVQKFVTSSLPEVLSEARKYGLSLVTANQYLGQLSGRTLEAVMGNVGTTIIFRCSPDDTQALVPYTKPQFTAGQLVDLNRFQAAIKLQIEGEVQPAFSLLTLPPLEPEDRAESFLTEIRIRELSAAAYTPKKREQVLEWLSARYPRRRPVEPPQETEEETFYDA